MESTKSPERQFEDEVRRIARLLWPSARYSGASFVDERERDGVFETEEMIHVLECTTSRRKDKAQQDIGKTMKLITQLRRRHPDKAIKGWFVTADEPTADQRLVSDKYKGTMGACSFDQFRSRLVDARSYLALRENLRFGSVRNLSDGTAAVAQNEFVGIDFLEYQSDTLWQITSIISKIENDRQSFVFIGDFG